MIKVQFKKDRKWFLFDSYEDVIIYLRAKAGLWKEKENNSNACYKKQVLKRIKRMYGIAYKNKNQSDEEFINNLCELGEIVDVIEVESGNVR